MNDLLTGRANLRNRRNLWTYPCYAALVCLMIFTSTGVSAQRTTVRPPPPPTQRAVGPLPTPNIANRGNVVAQPRVSVQTNTAQTPGPVRAPTAVPIRATRPGELDTRPAQQKPNSSGSPRPPPEEGSQDGGDSTPTPTTTPTPTPEASSTPTSTEEPSEILAASPSPTATPSPSTSTNLTGVSDQGGSTGTWYLWLILLVLAGGIILVASFVARRL